MPFTEVNVELFEGWVSLLIAHQDHLGTSWDTGSKGTKTYLFTAMGIYALSELDITNMFVYWSFSEHMLVFLLDVYLGEEPVRRRICVC